MRAGHRAWTLASLALGVAAGLGIPTVVLGVAPYHDVCVTGQILGWSGPVDAPATIAISPPGGHVNFSVNQINVGPPWYGGLGSFGSTYPESGVGFVSSVRNWTLRAVVAEREFGSGENASCAPYSLTASTVSQVSYVGTLGIGGAPAGIGVRSPTPTQLDGPAPSVDLAASYTLQPLVTFSWHANGDQVIVSSASNLSAFFSHVGQEVVNGSPAGLGLEANFNEIGFGVPIRNNVTALGTFPATEPGGFPGVTLQIHLTYILPADDDQGSWAVYYAGAGSTYPLGGYLFEQIE